MDTREGYVLESVETNGDFFTIDASRVLTISVCETEVSACNSATSNGFREVK